MESHPESGRSGKGQGTGEGEEEEEGKGCRCANVKKEQHKSESLQKPIRFLLVNYTHSMEISYISSFSYSRKTWWRIFYKV